MAVPNVALTFAPGYLAEDLGLFAKHGLNLKSVVITGIGSANAVISGSADFAQISGATLTRAAARGQRLLGIVGTLNRPVIQIVLRKEIAAAAGFDPKAPLERRAQVMLSLGAQLGARLGTKRQIRGQEFESLRAGQPRQRGFSLRSEKRVIRRCR